MRRQEKITAIDFKHIDATPMIDYNDGDVAFHRDINSLSFDMEIAKIDIHMMVVCKAGKMQLNLNMSTYTIGHNDLIVLRPGDMAGNLLMSPDFSAAVVCLSQRMFVELFSESDLWDKAFYFRETPMFHISDDSVEMFEAYGKIAAEKVVSTQRYRREIVHSVLRAVFYELLSNLSDVNPIATGLTRQRDVLFKRFIELVASSRIKPRCVAWYADKLCVSSKHLSTISKQVSGKTAHEWITEYVKADIIVYLKNTNRSIKEIAATLEFPSMSLFGKYCRQQFGLSPTDFRRQLRLSEPPQPNQPIAVGPRLC